MPSLPTPAEIGFAEFVGKLLSEVLDSVLSSQIEQERRLAELSASAALTLADAEALLVGEADVDAELARLFPADVPGGHAVYGGASYRPEGGGLAEEPPFAATLGVTLLAHVDYGPGQPAGQVLTVAGVAKIRAAARTRLAASLLAALRQIVGRGVPRVLVNSGRVNARMTFQLTSQAPSAAPASQLSPVFLGAAERARFALPTASLATSPPSSLRLTVRQASDRAPQVAQLQVDVYGEVEVTFRTVG